jgi:ankyrin repeat protein
MGDEQLLNAACDNRVADIRALVAGGEAADSQNRVGMSATHVAAMYGSVEALAALLELGAPHRLRCVQCCQQPRRADALRSVLCAVCAG